MTVHPTEGRLIDAVLGNLDSSKGLRAIKPVFASHQWDLV
jgi:hypothetical protein